MPDPEARRAVGALAGLAVLVALVVPAPAGLRPLAVVGAFALGAWAGAPARAAATRWARTLPPRRLAAAVALLAAAAAVIALPGGSEDAGEPAASAPQTRAAPPAAPLPQVRVVRARVGRAFVVDRVRFHVFVPGAEAWASALRARPPGARSKWLVLGVRATNLGRPKFNGNVLAYRLRAGGAVYAPVSSAGTGPEELGRSGNVPPGSASLSQLAFRLPRDAPAGALLFEPARNGPVQVRVDL